MHVALGDLRQTLDPQRFVQVHRSHVVAWDQVAGLKRYDERRLVVVLRDGETIVASRSASEALRRLAR
jgi:two-component system LytT family response regulator